MKINKLKITKSALFGESLAIDFSEKMTCIMGGRGTGKTTILTLIKWCLNDDAIFSKADLNLVKTNLGAGTVEVEITGPDQKLYTYIKNWGDSPIVKDVDEKVVDAEKIFPNKVVEYFSSGSIEQIGTDPFQRMKIIDSAVGSKIDELNREIGLTKAEIEKNQSELFHAREEYKKISHEIVILSDQEKQLIEAQKKLESQNPNDQEKEKFDEGIKKQQKRQLEVADLKNGNAVIGELKHVFQEFEGRLQFKMDALNSVIQSDNSEIQSIIVELTTLLGSGIEGVRQKLRDLSSIEHSLVVLGNSLRSTHQSEELQFAEVRKKLETNRDLYQKIATLNESVNKVNFLKKNLEGVSEKGTSLAARRTELINKFQMQHQARTDLRVQLAEELNKVSGENIRIAVKPSGEKSNFENFIRSILSLGKMKVTNEHLIWQLSSPTELLNAINQDELQKFADQLNLSPDRLDQIGKTIEIHDKKCVLETTVCDDQVNFYLKVDSSNDPSSYRPTEYLSLGQRCTTILPILFSVSNIPLIIDQPEDNLDNRFIADTIHKIIRDAKTKRQLTFVTHNPNIPVVADSEQNIFIKYEDRRSIVFASGTVGQVKGHIVELLEGGEEAFRLRKNCYGI